MPFTYFNHIQGDVAQVNICTNIITQQCSKISFKHSFICQGISTRIQRRNLFGLRVKLPPVTTSLTTQR